MMHGENAERRGHEMKRFEVQYNFRLKAEVAVAAGMSCDVRRTVRRLRRIPVQAVMPESVTVEQGSVETYTAVHCSHAGVWTADSKKIA